VKADHVTNAGDVANKASIFLAVFDTGGKALVGHRVHGFTPKFSKYNLASRTW
jgi:hypothetical protein